MPDLQYGLDNFTLSRGNFPAIPVVNMFAESIQTEGTPVKSYTGQIIDIPRPVLQSRMGLKNSGTALGTGPVTALYQVDGVLNGQMFGISGGNFYDGTTNKGAIDGTGPSRLAGFSNRVFACAGASLWEYDGTTLSSDATPGGFSVLSCCVGTDRLVIVDAGTGHFYWSNVLSDVVDALNFATAEQSPDKLKDCLFLGDTLMLFGSETVEFWPASSSDPNLPFSPLIGKTAQVGIRDTGCCSVFINTFAWITNHNRICMGDATNAISNESLEEALSNSTKASLWRFFYQGIEFLAVTLDKETWVFSSRSEQWSQFESNGQTNWIPRCYANGLFGSGIDGNLVEWSSTYDDFGGVLERRLRAGLPLTNEAVPLQNLMIRTNQGQTPYLTGNYINPVVELRTSKDGGYVWSNWKQRNLGEQGHYRNSVMWRSLGIFGYPYLLVEIRCTDPVPFRISGITINEGYAGGGDVTSA